MIVFRKNLFSKKLFCNHKNFQPKYFWCKFLVQNCFRWNDFATIKNFDQNIFINIFVATLFSRKWFSNHKKFSTKHFRWKILVKIFFRGNDFATIKNVRPKYFWWKFWVQPYSRENDVATIKNFPTRNFWSKFW